MNNMNSKSILNAVLASMEAHLEGCSDFDMNEIVLENGEVTHFELLNAYESLLQGSAKIIENPADREEMSLFVTRVAELVVTDAETQYDSTRSPGEVSDQLEREEALFKYTVSQEILNKLITDLELEVSKEDMASPMLDNIIKEVE